MTQRRMLSPLILFFLIMCTRYSYASAELPNLDSSVYDWNEMAVKKTDVGEVRSLIKNPTATLEELEMHITTLLPGQMSHPPHRHVNEELIIIREGTVETLSKGEWKKVGPGSVIFNASNSLHALRNVGKIPAIYHVVNWKSAETTRLQTQQPNDNKGAQ